MKELKYKKGYLIEVKSWENDGDINKTKSYVLSNKEDARLIAKICKELFASGSNNGTSIGNGPDDSDYRIETYFEKNPQLPKSLWNEVNIEIMDIPAVIEFITDELIGHSEFYDYRVCESVKVYNIPEDIYLESIHL